MSEEAVTPVMMDTLTFPLHGSRLIEAGAGTGKTYTIAQLYTRLVLGHGEKESRFSRPLLPAEILVVTFAESAKLELRDRIRRRLIEAARVFRGVESEDPDLAILRDSYIPSLRAHAARMLDYASEWMDEAAIFTIHGWCLRTLRHHAFESGVAFAQETSANTLEMLGETVRDYWRENFYRVTPAQANELVALFPNPEKLQQAIQPLLAPEHGEIRYGDQPRPIPADVVAVLERSVDEKARCDTLEARARTLWRDDREALHGILHELREHLNARTFRGRDNDEQFDGWLFELDQWASGAAGAADPPWILDKLNPDTIPLKKSGTIPDHPFFSALSNWYAAQSHRDPAATATDIVIHAAADIRTRFERIKERQSLLDYNDMLIQLDRALVDDNGKVLAEAIRREYPIVMVDEFQDTDQVQFRIFDTIYRTAENNPDTGLFLIGDPKQAIYRFRGADIFTYLRARKATAGRHYSLSTNYRSTTSLVEATNHLFLAADQHARGAFLFGPGQDGEIPFLPALPRNDPNGKSAWSLELDGNAVAAITIWTLDEVAGTIASGAFRTKIASHVGESIARWLRENDRSGFRSEDTFLPLRPDDIAVLVRDRNEADAVLDALRVNGVAGVYLSARDSVFSTPEAEDLLRWVKACMEPEQTILVRAALATQTLGLPFEELERSAEDDLLQDLHAERFTRYRDLFHRDGILPAIRALLHDYRVSTRLLDQPRGERSLTNILHLAEWLHQAGTAVENRRELIQLLSDQIANPGEEQILRLESDDECVRVVTVFKSKGLEYNFVLAPFMCVPRREEGKQKKNGPPVPITWHDDQNKRILEFQPSEAPRAHVALERERMSEEMRLLYVALTRGRYAVQFAVAPVVRGVSKTPGIHTSGVGYMLAGGESFASGSDIYERLRRMHADHQAIAIKPVAEHPAAHHAPTIDQTTIERTLSARVPHRSPPESWWIASYTALNRPTASGMIEDRLPPEPEDSAQIIAQEEAGHPDDRGANAGIHRFPAGPRAGTFFHALIEEFAREGFARLLNDPVEREDRIRRACSGRGWDDWTPTIVAWMDRFLTGGFSIASGALQPPVVLAEVADYRAEIEFLFPSNHVRAADLDRCVRKYVLPDSDRPRRRELVMNGMFKGFIDLVFLHNGRYYLADWKSNYLGTDTSAYSPPALERAILEKRYDLQLAVYTLAVHRHLVSRLPDYHYERDFGGVIYLFLRGLVAEHRGTDTGPDNGVFFVRPEFQLVSELDRLFSGSRE